MEEQIKTKLIEQLDVWCVTFMLIGSQGETPRYSQILANEEFTNWNLESTISGISYEIQWTPEELEWLDEMQCDNLLWDWWKRIRTEHLIGNYPTISAY